MELKWVLLLGLLLPSCSASAIGFKIHDCEKMFINPDGSFNCTCNKGLSVNSITGLCEDEDECARRPCGDNARCFNTRGSYFCICDGGFKSNTHNFTQTTGQCLDINECIEKTPVCSGDMECVNIIGSYKCTCPKGYRETRLDSCADINECTDPDVCGTNGTCYNHPGRYSCKCHQGYGNYGNNQSKCIAMNCDQFKPGPDAGHTMEKLKHLMSLLKKNCETLDDPQAEHFTGEMLLETLCNSTDNLLTDGNIASGEMLSQFLDTVENSMRLIGPQLKEPVTRMETHNTIAEVAVRRSQTLPTGSVTLSSDSTLFNTSWETVVGKSYPGFAFVALVSYKDLDTSGDQFNKISRTSQEQESRGGEITYQLNSKVVTAVVSNPETKQLSKPVMLVFTHTEVKIPNSTTTGKTIAAFPPQELSPGTRDFGVVLSVF